MIKMLILSKIIATKYINKYLISNLWTIKNIDKNHE